MHKERFSSPEPDIGLTKDLPKTDEGEGKAQFEKPPLNLSFSQRRALEMTKKKEKKEKKERDRMISALKDRGVPEQHHEAIIAQAEYAKMSPDEKIRRLESMIVGGLKGLSQEMIALHHNDTEVASAMDVNFRAMAKALKKLGIDEEQLKAIMEESHQEIEADYAAREQARAQEQKQMGEEIAETINKSDLSAVDSVIEKRAITSTIDNAGTPDVSSHADAVVFGD